MEEIKRKIAAAISKRVLFLPHAIHQMSRPDRMITSEEVEEVLRTGEVIENYPEDKRGHSCLVLGFGKARRPIHVVCAPKAEYLAIITAYIPDPGVWSDDFMRRKA